MHEKLKKYKLIIYGLFINRNLHMKEIRKKQDVKLTHIYMTTDCVHGPLVDQHTHVSNLLQTKSKNTLKMLRKLYVWILSLTLCFSYYVSVLTLSSCAHRVLLQKCILYDINILMHASI